FLHYIGEFEAGSPDGDKQMEKEICSFFDRAFVHAVFNRKDELGRFFAHFLQYLVYPFFIREKAGRIRIGTGILCTFANHFPDLCQDMGVSGFFHAASAGSRTSPISRPKNRRHRMRAFSILQPAFPMAMPRSLLCRTNTFTGAFPSPCSVFMTSAGLKMLAMNVSGVSAYSTISIRFPSTFWRRLIFSPFLPIARPMSPGRTT